MQKNRARHWWKPALCGVSMLLGAALPAHADPVWVAQSGDTVVTLYSEDCKLPVVKNLPKRATWTSNGKTFEGCYGGMAEFSFVIMYFEDLTAVGLPMQFFVKVSGA